MSSFLDKYDAAMQLRRDSNIDAAWDAMQQLQATYPLEPLVATTLAAWHKHRGDVGDIDAAITEAERYCELAPEDPFGFSILSSYYIGAGRRNDAETALMTVQRLRMSQTFTANYANDTNDES